MGNLRVSWPPGNALGTPQWKYSDELTLPALTDRFDVDGAGNIRNAMIPYLEQDAGLFTLAWGHTKNPQDLNLDVDSLEHWGGLLLGSGQDNDLLPIVPANENRFIASATLYVYVDPSDTDTPPDLRQVESVATWKIAEISEWDHGLRNVVFGDPRILALEDFRQGEIRKNTVPFLGFRLEFEMAYAQIGTKKIWARLTESRDAGISLGETPTLDLVYRRDYQIRWVSRSVLDVTSRITDADGEVWVVLERNEIGRRRFVEIVCERKVFPDG